MANKGGRGGGRDSLLGISIGQEDYKSKPHNFKTALKNRKILSSHDSLKTKVEFDTK